MNIFKKIRKDFITLKFHFYIFYAFVLYTYIHKLYIFNVFLYIYCNILYISMIYAPISFLSLMILRDFHGIEEKILILNLMYNFIGSRDLFVSKNF